MNPAHALSAEGGHPAAKHIAGLVIRPATEDDTPAMHAIYSPYCQHTAITFDLDPPEIAAYRAKIASMVASHAVLVAVIGGEVVGYAYAGPFHERLAYQWSCSAGIYLRSEPAAPPGTRAGVSPSTSAEDWAGQALQMDPAVHGRGVGRQLYTALLDRLRERGYRNAFALIALPNDASVAIHRKLGFREVGVCKRVGWKLGKWWDVGYWQLDLGGGDQEPSTLT